MWVLPTYKRPEKCQQTLDTIIKVGCSTPGVVIVDGDPDPAYEKLRVPAGWRVLRLEKNGGMLHALNYAFLKKYPNEPWYGLLNDDMVIVTPKWDEALVEAAGNFGFAHSDDGWQAPRRMCGATVFGGDLLRTLGWWAPPGLFHCYADDAWETIGRTLNIWRPVMDVLVEHRHRLNKKAEDDETYRHAYSKFDEDRNVWLNFRATELQAAIHRVHTALGASLTDEQTARLNRLKTRKVYFATPVARRPCWQYTMSMMNTILGFERLAGQGSHQLQFLVGSSNLPRARNELVAFFLNSDCDDLVFIDDDMSWKPNDLFRLIASDKPFIGAVGRKKTDSKPDTDPGVWCARFFPRTDIVQDAMGAINVIGVGTGFLKIERTVFEKIIKAHPELKRKGPKHLTAAVEANFYRFFHFPDDNDCTGEDFEFCNLWRSLGGTVWIDPEIQVDHIGDATFRGSIREMLQVQDDPKEAAA